MPAFFPPGTQWLSDPAAESFFFLFAIIKASASGDALRNLPPASVLAPAAPYARVILPVDTFLSSGKCLGIPPETPLITDPPPDIY